MEVRREAGKEGGKGGEEERRNGEHNVLYVSLQELGFSLLPPLLPPSLPPSLYYGI